MGSSSNNSSGSMDLAQASELLGVSVPVLRFLIAFAATLPASWAWRLVPGTLPAVRHAYAAVSGLLLTYLAFGWQAVLLCALPVLASYLSMLLFRPRCGSLTFLLAFGFLLACHVRFMSGDAWKQGGIDATGALMVLTLNVIAAAMNYQDGSPSAIAHLQKQQQREQQSQQEQKLRPQQQLDKERERRIIRTLPSPIQYLGFCSCCGTHLAGPVYEYRDYEDWTNREGLWAGPVPPPWGATLRAVARSAICMLLFMYLSPLFPLAFLSTPAYQGWPVWKRFCFIWSLSEAAVIVSGLGFSGLGPGGPKWDRARNVDIPRVEFVGSGAELPLFWNIHVGTWLRVYVYQRLVGRGRKPGFLQLLATQVVSAVWHGLYSGYLLFFVHTALMIAGSRVIYKWQLAMARTRLGRAAAWLLGASFASFVLHYSCIGFFGAGCVRHDPRLPQHVVVRNRAAHTGHPFRPPGEATKDCQDTCCKQGQGSMTTILLNFCPVASSSAFRFLFQAHGACNTAMGRQVTVLISLAAGRPSLPRQN